MPAPHAFWVIVDGATPTAFRAKQRDVLVPTLKQLQRTQPNVVLRWFDRGQLWESPLAARDALRARRLVRPDRRPEWRPGGNHVDPKERFKLTRDQKRARFKKRQAWTKSWKPESQEPGRPGSQAAGKPASREARKPGSWRGGKIGSQGVRKFGGPGAAKFGQRTGARDRRSSPPKRGR